jgi:HME family heavy-metal exporter
VSLLVTALVFRYFGLSINTMTLGGLAIAIGELVDDAVVGVENVLRRLKLNRAWPHAAPGREVIAAATLEVRSAIVYATVIIVLVFVPLFVLPGIEGRLFTPLGVAYIVSILASMIVSVTLTPVLAYYLLPGMKQLHAGDSPLVIWLKRWTRACCTGPSPRPRLLIGALLLVAALAAASVPFFPRSFLPPFNEGTLTVNVLLNPGTSLAESNRIGTLAEQLVAERAGGDQGRPPHRARRTRRACRGRALHRNGRRPQGVRTQPAEAIIADIRARLAVLPAAATSASRSRTASTTCSPACARRSR